MRHEYGSGQAEQHCKLYIYSAIWTQLWSWRFCLDLCTHFTQLECLEPVMVYSVNMSTLYKQTSYLEQMTALKPNKTNNKTLMSTNPVQQFLFLIVFPRVNWSNNSVHMYCKNVYTSVHNHHIALLYTHLYCITGLLNCTAEKATLIKLF